MWASSKNAPSSPEARAADQSRSLPRLRLVQLHVLFGWPDGQLVTAPPSRLGLRTGIEAAIGAGSRIERTEYDN
jgi:hypothetical protein